MKRAVRATMVLVSVTVAGVLPAVANAEVQTSTGGMKITAVAKGDCAQNATTILVTDATTTCSIEISVTPAKKYADVSIIEPLSRTSFAFPTWTTDDGKVKVSAKGKGSIGILKAVSDCVLTSGAAKVVAQVTNAKTFNGSFTAQAKSKPITVTFQQTVPTTGCSRTVGR